MACVLACLPARAVELIDLHDLRDGVLRVVLVRDHARSFLPDKLPADNAGALPGYRIENYIDNYIDNHIVYLPGEDTAGIPVEISPGMPWPAEIWPAAGANASPVPTPVPEPVAVLMLACGLLLIMPGAWAARWSRLGDTESLLQRRLP
jgi:hypothetical protein